MAEDSISDTSPKVYIILDEVQVSCLHITISILFTKIKNLLTLQLYIDHPCMPIIQLYIELYKTLTM